MRLVPVRSMLKSETKAPAGILAGPAVSIADISRSPSPVPPGDVIWSTLHSEVGRGKLAPYLQRQQGLEAQ